MQIAWPCHPTHAGCNDFIALQWFLVTNTSSLALSHIHCSFVTPRTIIYDATQLIWINLTEYNVVTFFSAPGKPVQIERNDFRELQNNPLFLTFCWCPTASFDSRPFPSFWSLFILAYHSVPSLLRWFQCLWLVILSSLVPVQFLVASHTLFGPQLLNQLFPIG